MIARRTRAAETSRARGLVFVLGEPHYYARFGFDCAMPPRRVPPHPMPGRIFRRCGCRTMRRPRGTVALRVAAFAALVRPCRATSSSSNITARRIVGWQYQADGPAIQGAIEDRDRAIRQMRKSRSRARGAPMPACTRSVRSRISTLPASMTAAPCAMRSISICGRSRSRCCAAERVTDDFNARFSATQRHYLYRIVNRRPDLAHRARARVAGRAPARHRGDAGAAAKRLLGNHDFTTFRSTECQAKSPVKTLDQLDVETTGDEGPRARVGALLPAQPGALDGRLAGACRRGQMERRTISPPCLPRATARLRAGGAAGGALSGAGGLLTFIDYRFLYIGLYSKTRDVCDQLRRVGPWWPRVACDSRGGRTQWSAGAGAGPQRLRPAAPKRLARGVSASAHA